MKKKSTFLSITPQKMEEEFPHKWERGRKLGIQSSNTLRRNGIFYFKPDTFVVREPDETPITYCSRMREISVNKQKRWELIEEAEKDPSVIFVEYHSFPSRPKLSINGAGPTSCDTTPVASGPPSTKTVSRAAKKRGQQRKLELERAEANAPRPDQTYWEIDRNAPDPKYFHRENQQTVRSSWFDDDSPGKVQRRALKQKLSALERGKTDVL